MRLLSVLDISAEMILLINDKLQIVYANELANNLLQTKGRDRDNKSLLGQHIHHFIDARLSRLLTRALEEEQNELLNTETLDEQAGLIWQATIKRFHQDDSCYLALMMQSRSIDEALPANDALNQLTRELSESRQKIHDIESTLRLVLGQSDSEDKAEHPDDIQNLIGNQTKALTRTIPAQSSEDIDPEQDQAEAADDPKEAIVSLLRNSLNLWERYTNKGKVELAEQSRCWRVYVDGTTVKTRTFDKYLSARSIPARPRWRAVVRTANFVLANCQLNDQEKSLLTQLRSQVENYYS